MMAPGCRLTGAIRGVWVVGMLSLPACSQLPAAPDRPQVNPRAAARLALESFDTDGDGLIDQREAEQSPGLSVAMEAADVDGDEALSAEEIANRIAYYKSAATIIDSTGLEIYVDGRPLAGATVTLEPEPFLGDTFTACESQTDYNGEVRFQGHHPKLPGIYLGMYRVKVSLKRDGQEKVPAKYNTQTTLGFEARDDRPNVMNIPRLSLRSK